MGKTLKQKYIEERDGIVIPKRYQRKRKKYSNNFNVMFNFFLQSYRKDILTFCGVHVDVDFDINAEESKYVFRSYDNGDFKFKIPITKHPNILKAVIIGKKSWGLFLQEWTDGITDGLFTKQEIFYEFEKVGITIPESLLQDFYNVLYKKFKKKYNW